jgi:hypothetical protein
MELRLGPGLQLDEDRLIRAGRRGDQHAVATLFRRYQRRPFCCGWPGLIRSNANVQPRLPQGEFAQVDQGVSRSKRSTPRS